MSGAPVSNRDVRFGNWRADLMDVVFDVRQEVARVAGTAMAGYQVVGFLSWDWGLFSSTTRT